MNQAILRVALVDDEEGVRKALGRLLRSAGIEVAASFSSGRDFLGAAEGLRLDCLVLDLHMPAMSGLEVHQELVRSGSRLPVVIITGHDKPEYRAQALGAGVAAYLPKPVDAKVLLAAIAAAAAGTKSALT